MAILLCLVFLINYWINVFGSQKSQGFLNWNWVKFIYFIGCQLRHLPHRVRGGRRFLLVPGRPRGRGRWLTRAKASGQAVTEEGVELPVDVRQGHRRGRILWPHASKSHWETRPKTWLCAAPGGRLLQEKAVPGQVVRALAPPAAWPTLVRLCCLGLHLQQSLYGHL